MKFNYVNTTKVFFTDRLEEIGDYIASMNYRRPLIITGCTYSAMKANDIVNTLSCDEYKIISGVSTNANCDFVKENLKSVSDFLPDVIITVGGGSVHDTGKAISVMLYSDDKADIEDYTVDGKLSVPGIKKTLPIITIPTLVGSGAEVSPAALIQIGNKKRVMFSTLLHPTATFVNNSFLETLSINKISRSAFDSLVQALEGFISTSANAISDAFAIQTISYFNEVYLSLKEDKVTMKEYEKLSVASIFSSYVCSTASVGAIHALSDPISGRYNIHHGSALAMVAVYVLKYNLEAVDDDKVEKLDNMLFNVTSSQENVRTRVIEKIANIIVELHLLENVEKIRADKETIKLMCKESFNPDMAGNPYEYSEEEVALIFNGVFND